MAGFTQKERLAAAETRQGAHDREHELNDRVWSAKLDSIDARIRGIERILLEVRLPLNGTTPSVAWPRLGKRDLGVISGSAAATSLAWWLAEVLQSLAGG